MAEVLRGERGLRLGGRVQLLVQPIAIGSFFAASSFARGDGGVAAEILGVFQGGIPLRIGRMGAAKHALSKAGCTSTTRLRYLVSVRGNAGKPPKRTKPAFRPEEARSDPNVGLLARMSELIIFIAKIFLKNAQNFAICEFFRAPFPTRAARRPVYLQLRGPFVFPRAETCPKKLTYRGFLCQNEKFRGNKNYLLRHSGPTGHFGLRHSYFPWVVLDDRALTYRRRH